MMSLFFLKLYFFVYSAPSEPLSFLRGCHCRKFGQGSLEHHPPSGSGFDQRESPAHPASTLMSSAKGDADSF